METPMSVMRAAEFHPLITRRCPYGVCWVRDCWEPAAIGAPYCGRHSDCQRRLLVGVPDDLGDLDWEAAEETYLDMLVTPATTREAVEAVVRAALGLKEGE